MLTLSEIQAKMLLIQKICQRGVFDLETSAEKALPLIHEMTDQLQIYLNTHPDDAPVLKYMSYIQCYLLNYGKALQFLEKSCSLAKDSKERINLAKLQGLLTLLESMALQPAQIIDLKDYLKNALDENNCDHSLNLTRKWLKEHVISDKHEIVLAGFRNAGGYCDCEVIFSVTDF